VSPSGAPYRDAPPELETLALDEAARAHVDETKARATRRVMICAMLLTAFATGAYESGGILLAFFPLDFFAIGLFVEIVLELRHGARARADEAAGMVRGVAELRWRDGGWRWVLSDGRTFHPRDSKRALGRYRVTVLPRLGDVLSEELVDEAAPEEARAVQTEALDQVLHVTPASLEANQAGRLTRAQRSRMFRRAIWPSLATGLYLIYFSAAGFIWQSLLLGFPGLIAFGVLSYRIGAGLYGRVRAYDGVTTPRRRGGKYVSCWLLVGDELIPTDEEVLRAFRLEGARHRVFASTLDRRVLAVRCLD
jgi:hypothetical protein